MKRIAVAVLMAMATASAAADDCGRLVCPQHQGLGDLQFLIQAACDHPVNKTEADAKMNKETCEQLKKQQREQDLKEYEGINKTLDAPTSAPK